MIRYNVLRITKNADLTKRNRVQNTVLKHLIHYGENRCIQCKNYETFVYNVKNPDGTILKSMELSAMENFKQYEIYYEFSMKTMENCLVLHCNN